MNQAVVLWAWSHHDEQHVETLALPSVEVALSLGLALERLQDVYLYSKVRVFRADLEELTLTPPSTSFAETRPGPSR